MKETEELFYDGGCGLCHRTVLFLLNRGERGMLFRFSPLGGETFHRSLSAEIRAGLPDSVVILTASGEVLSRSRAVLHMLDALGGGWRLLGWAGRILPRILADLLYDGIAGFRGRLFAKPGSDCPALTAAQRRRFDP